MEILLVARNRLVRDQVKVGLQQFPEFSITWGEGYAAINEVRQKHYDCIFLAIEGQGSDAEGVRLLRHLRTFERGVEVVAIVGDRHARDLASEKSRLNIVGMLHTPIDASEFFRTVARLRARKQELAAQR